MLHFFGFKKTFQSLFFLLLMLPAIAQHETIYAENAVGKISGDETAAYFKRIDAVKNLNKAKAASLKQCLATQLKILYSDPVFNPPKGFNARTSFGIDIDPFDKGISFPPCSFHFDFYYLDKDDKKGGIKVSMDGTSVGMETNAVEHFFSQVGNFWKDCSDAQFPLFFEEPPVSDSTADYIEMDFKKYGYAHIAPNKPFRIIKRNDKPLFIPLSRKEFVQFLIAQKKFQVSEYEKTIADLQKNVKETEETLKNPPSYLSESTKKALTDGNALMKKNIDKTQDKINNFQTKIREYETEINAMSLQEAESSARIDENKTAPDFDDLKRLVPVGRMEGVGLYKVNPDYYDNSATAPGAQLIFVYYNLPNLSVFEKTQFNYLEKKTMDIFNHLDYDALKMCMK
jgi:hypothetical protein